MCLVADAHTKVNCMYMCVCVFVCVCVCVCFMLVGRMHHGEALTDRKSTFQAHFAQVFSEAEVKEFVEV